MQYLHPTIVCCLLLCGSLATGVRLNAEDQPSLKQISDGSPPQENRTQVETLVSNPVESIGSPESRSSATEPTPAEPTTAQTETSNSQIPAPTTATEEFAFPVEHHLWAKFPIGSWREIEVTTETFDESGKVFGRSVTTQRETLKALAEDGYVLETQATVDVSGKQIVGPVNTRVLRLLTDRSGVIFSSTRSGDEILVIDEMPDKCQVWDILYNEETQNLRDRIYYSADQFPHVLRRETYAMAENLPPGTTPRETSNVIARHVPFAKNDRIMSCVCENSTRLRDKGSIHNLRMLSPEIPGGEVQTWSTDYNAAGQPNRWSILKLLDYGVNSPVEEPVVR